jgi:transcriptional regulator
MRFIVAASKVKSPIQKQIEALEEKGAILDRIVSVAKTEGGRITDDGKNLYHILRQAGLNKSEIARILDVTPSALTKYD